MTCDNVFASAKVTAANTARNTGAGIVVGSGINFTTKDVQVAGVKHQEGVTPSALNVKIETDALVTPDAGDTDSCTGLTTVSDATAAVSPLIPDFSAAPFGPLWDSAAPAAPIAEITKISGKLTGRADCDPALPGSDHAWTLSGKLTVEYGDVGGPGAGTAILDANGKKVSSQVYARINPNNALNVDLDLDTAGDTPDRVQLLGIVIKGVGVGADWGGNAAYRPPTANLAYAAEACSFNFDLDLDTIVGQPSKGGLIDIGLDTDVDTTADGVAAPPPVVALYNGAFLTTIPDGN
jgi:hypothetical protein